MASLRAKAAFKKLAENGGKSVSRAMREAGYSKVTASTPSKLTKSKSWQELMDEFLPNEMIANAHSELINAGRKFGKEFVPDYKARAKGIDMAHKLRGNYAPERIELSKRKFQDKSNEELLAIAQKKLKKTKE